VEAAARIPTQYGSAMSGDRSETRGNILLFIENQNVPFCLFTRRLATAEISYFCFVKVSSVRNRLS
jgi:hypothetical protein